MNKIVGGIRTQGLITCSPESSSGTSSGSYVETLILFATAIFANESMILQS